MGPGRSLFALSGRAHQAAGDITAMPQHGVGPAMGRLHASLPVPVKQLAERSLLYRALIYMRRATTDEDVAGVQGIVTEAATELRSNYPGIQFHVIVWDFSQQENPTERALITALRSAGLNCISCRSCCPSISRTGTTTFSSCRRPSECPSA